MSYSNTPMALKRRTISRIAASNPRVRSMEQRAHTNSIQEYCTEIFEHLSELEERTKLNPELIRSQPEISIQMRPILFDFLMDVHNRLKLSKSTFFLTINIIDRYCSSRIVRKDHFQLLGLSALWLASKFSDSKHKVPTLDFLRATCCNCYSKNLFIEMETHILKSLNWEIGSSGHDSFIDLMLKGKLNCENTTPELINSIKYGANYLCQLMQFYTRITFNYSISQIAIASISIISSALTLSNENEFVHYKTTTNNNLKLTKLIESILLIIRENQPPQSFKMKYFNKLDDLRTNPNLYSIYQYSNEVNRLNTISKLSTTNVVSNINRSKPLTNITTSLMTTSTSSEMYPQPQTPSSMCSTPISSRASSTSSESSTFSTNSGNSQDTVMDDISIHTTSTSKTITIVTPPNSCSSSPMVRKDEKQHRRSSSRIFTIPNLSESRRVSLQELRIVAPQGFHHEDIKGIDYIQSVEEADYTIRKRSLEI